MKELCVEVCVQDCSSLCERVVCESVLCERVVHFPCETDVDVTKGHSGRTW